MSIIGVMAQHTKSQPNYLLQHTLNFLWTGLNNRSIMKMCFLLKLVSIQFLRILCLILYLLCVSRMWCCLSYAQCNTSSVVEIKLSWLCWQLEEFCAYLVTRAFRQDYSKIVKTWVKLVFAVRAFCHAVTAVWNSLVQSITSNILCFTSLNICCELNILIVLIVY